MKKIITIFTIISVLIIPFKVNAEQGYIVGRDDTYAKDVYSPINARFYDFDLNSYQLTNISTQYSDGFGFIPDPITAILTDQYGPGSAIGYDVNDVFLSGYVYSVITYLCAIPSSAYPMINTFRTGIQTGQGLTATRDSYVSGGRANIIYSFNQISTTPVRGTGNFNCGRLVYVFEATNTGNTIIVPFISSTTVNNWTFFGYNITSYGQRSSLTSSDVQNIINNSIATTNQSISNAENNINNNIDNTRNSINNTISNSTNQIDNTIKDDTTSDPSNDITSFEQYVATNSTISSLLLLPVTLYQNILNSINTTCTPYDAGSLLGTHIIFPCINIANYIGSTLWNVIDVLLSGIFVYNISRHFIKVFDNMSSMKDGDVIND